MTYRTFFFSLLILGFMALIGYCMARAIQWNSFVGFVLAITSWSAGIYFLYLLNKARNIPETGSEETA
jgi:hypothetical protein